MPHTPPLLEDLLLLILVSVPIAFISHRLRLPMVVGFMLTGVVFGPHGLGLIRDAEAVEVMADIGVALLLFVIGLEFSLRRLLEMRRALTIGGGVQVLVTTGLVTAGLAAAGRPLAEALFFGFLLALSSTALVLRSYVDRAEIDAPHARAGLGILLFQDLCIIPMMVLVPILSGRVGFSPGELAWALGKAALAVVAIVVAARLLVPVLLKQVVQLRSSEVFVLFAALVVFGTSWLTGQLGLSLAVGAFIAGLVLSESEYSHQIVADFLPFRDVFNSLFFVSIGMLLSLQVVEERLWFVLGVAALLVGLKAAITTGAVRLLGLPGRVAFMTGLGLAQVGEFSFVLAKEGQGQGLLGETDYQVFLAVSILSMLATPFLIRLAPRLAYGGQELAEAAMASRRGKVAPPHDNHVVVVGFGLNGRNLARVLRNAGIPYVVLDLNADLAAEAMRRDEPVIYGDATRREVLHRAGIETARVLVLAISDPIASRHTVHLARGMNRRLHIIVRTRYMHDHEDLLATGADEVIPEEFETSIQIFGRVLKQFEVPPEEIRREITAVRREGYEILRSIPPTVDPPEPGGRRSLIIDGL